MKAHTWPDFINELLCFSGHFMSLFLASCRSLVSLFRIVIVSAMHRLLWTSPTFIHCGVLIERRSAVAEKARDDISLQIFRSEFLWRLRYDTCRI